MWEVVRGSGLGLVGQKESERSEVMGEEEREVGVVVLHVGFLGSLLTWGRVIVLGDGAQAVCLEGYTGREAREEPVIESHVHPCMWAGRFETSRKEVFQPQGNF